MDAEAPVVGRTVREVSWPARTVLTSILRGGELVLPHGDAVLQAGDLVVTLVAGGGAAELSRLLTGGDPASGSGT